VWQLHDKLQMAVTVCRIWRKILLYNKDTTRRYLHIFSYKMLYRTAFVSSCVEVFQLLGAILENQWSHLRLFEPQYFSNQFPFPVGGSKKSSSCMTQYIYNLWQTTWNTVEFVMNLHLSTLTSFNISQLQEKCHFIYNIPQNMLQQK